MHSFILESFFMLSVFTFSQQNIDRGVTSVPEQLKSILKIRSLTQVDVPTHNPSLVASLYSMY
jgi:hypothetical protein